MGPESTFFYPVVGAIISMLLAGNVFFIRGLINKIDSTALAVAALQTSLATTVATLTGSATSLSGSVNGIGNQLREIKTDIKELRRIEIDVAVLKAQYHQQPNGEGEPT